MSENDVLSKSLASSSRASWLRLASYLIRAILAIGLMALATWVIFTARTDSIVSNPDTPPTVPAAVSAQWQRPVISAAGLVDRVGVHITHVAISGGGGLIDLRYEVIDPDKAAAVHDEATPPVIVDDTSGVVVDQLLMGHAHSGTFKAGQTYYLIFENPGNLVQTGSTVSVLLGNAEVEHVPVQ